MNLTTAQASIGKSVISWDHGNGARVELKIGRDPPLGPFILLQITKQGYAIVRGMEHLRLRPSLLFLVEGLEEFCPPSLEEQLKAEPKDCQNMRSEPIAFQHSFVAPPNPPATADELERFHQWFRNKTLQADERQWAKEYDGLMPVPLARVPKWLLERFRQATEQ